MKGLIDIPSIKNITRAYHQLQDSTYSASPKKWAQWSQWSRFDARLAEQLVLDIYKHWHFISPIELNHQIQQQPWPACFGVLLEQTLLGISKKNPQYKFFQQWEKLVMFDIAPASFEQFFIGTMEFASSRMFREASSPTKPYIKWGYLGKDVLWNKSKNTNQTTSTKQARLNALDEMIKKKKQITVTEYIQKLDGTIHIRQAQRDLASNPRLKKMGKTNNQIYIVRNK